MRLATLLLFTIGIATAHESWVELGPSGTLARFASRSGARCPAIVLDGKTQAMNLRKPTGNFSALVCEAIIPDGTKTASIKREKLPLPKWRKDNKPNVVVIGDTGCRIKQGGDDGAAGASSTANAKWNIQNCQSPSDWPFQEVARNAAALNPDLVIHVGDYLYRERNCAGVQHCPGGPSGNNMETWEADFFLPARKLLQSAPWVFVRGNHESCERAGDGWFTLLDPGPVRDCMVFTPPYLVKAGALSLAVLDDSTASDAACSAGDAKCAAEFGREVQEYTDQFRTISAWQLDHVWMLSHRLVWSVKSGPDHSLQVLNAALEAAWESEKPAGVDLLLAGHTHVFEALGFPVQSGKPTQLVVGNSGTMLAPALTFNPGDPAIVQAQIHGFEKIQDFGFTTLQAQGDSWLAEAHDRNGKVHVRCSVPFTGGRCAE